MQVGVYGQNLIAGNEDTHLFMNVHTYTHARTCISFHVNQALATRRGTNPICASCGPLHLSHVPFVTVSCGSLHLSHVLKIEKSESFVQSWFRCSFIIIISLSLSLSESLSLLVSFVRPLFWGCDLLQLGSHVLKSDSFGGATYKP